MDYFIKPYLIFLLPLLISGCGNYSSNEDTVDGKIKPIVISISPSEGETNVEVTTSISLQFSQGINTNSITINDSNTNCSGTVQISTDNFSTCTKMSSVVGNSNNNKTISVTPESSLNGETNYHTKVTTELTGDSGNNLSGQFTTSQGFTTKDITPPTVSTISPSDNESEVSVGSSVSITFSETIETSTVTTNTSDTSCSGSLMVSSDNFSSCVKMSSSPVASNSNKTFSSTPSDNYSYSTTYKMRVSTGVKDTSENSMANTYETSSGFHTDTWVGTQQLGTGESGGSVYAQAIAIDSSNNIYITGRGGGVDGNSTFGQTDNFLVKYNSSGFKQWSTVWGSSGTDYSDDVAVDSSGNIYTTGHNYKSGYGNEVTLVKHNSSGTQQWEVTLSTSSSESGYGVTVDSSNNIYVTGYTNGALDGTNSGFGDIFLTKYYDNGTKQWTKQTGSTSQDYGHSVTVDSSDNIYVTGVTNTNIFINKYYDNGTIQWSKELNSSSDVAKGVAVDSSNNIYVTGYTSGGLDNNTNSGGYDIFLVKYNSSGDKQWTQQLGTSAPDFGLGVTVDSSNKIYVTGYTSGGLDNNTNSGVQDIFLVKYNSSGEKQWTKQLGTSSDDRGYGVTVDSSNKIYVTGYTSGGLDGVTNKGGAELFILKYNSSGVLQ